MCRWTDNWKMWRLTFVIIWHDYIPSFRCEFVCEDEVVGHKPEAVWQKQQKASGLSRRIRAADTFSGIHFQWPVGHLTTTGGVSICFRVKRETEKDERAPCSTFTQYIQFCAYLELARLNDNNPSSLNSLLTL
jgi:hypothetical protein